MHKTLTLFQLRVAIMQALWTSIGLDSEDLHTRMLKLRLSRNITYNICPIQFLINNVITLSSNDKQYYQTRQSPSLLIFSTFQYCYAFTMVHEMTILFLCCKYIVTAHVYVPFPYIFSSSRSVFLPYFHLEY